MEKSTVSIQRAENSSQLWLQDAFLHLACMEFQRVQRLDLSLVSIYSIKAHQLQGKKNWLQSTSLQGKLQPCGGRMQGRALC